MATTIGPDFIALQVRYLEASRRFYSERLGLPPAPQSPPNAAVFATEPIPFAVREPAVDLEAVERLGWGVALWLRAEDPEGLCESLRRAGVEIAQEPVDGPFGRQFSFVDPDGYQLTVHGEA